MSTAFSPNTHWDVQPGTGNDNNGGSFVNGASGTDYSKQASPQYALTGIASSGSGDTVLSAAAASDMVGNGAKVISGTNFNTGFFNIISVVAGISITFSQNAAGQSICSGVGASGVINIGGSLATVSAANAALLKGNRVWIKGTYTVTSALSLAVNLTNSNANPTVFSGYGTTHGDGTRAVWTTSTNSIDLIRFANGSGYVFENIDFSSTAGTPGNGLNANSGSDAYGIVLDNCLVHGFVVGVLGDWNTDWSFNVLILYRTSVYSCTSHGVWNDGSTFLLGCYIHDNGGDGMRTGINNNASPQGGSVCWRTVIKSNGGRGINDLTAGISATSGRFWIILESDVLDSTSHNFDCSSGSGPVGVVILNSIIDGSGGWGVNGNTSMLFRLLGSIGWRSNTSGDIQNIAKSATDVTLTGDPFTNRSTGDFSLNGTSGAGAACKAIGQPTTFPPA